MENKVKFRNHFSSVFQHLSTLIWVFVIALISGAVSGSKTEMLISGACWLGIGILLIVYKIILWAKTWIVIDETQMIIECNTWFSRRKKTIGLRNISNVNLEQGLLGMLIGTCKLKIDTNSMTTAEATDVTIVLKKREAEEIRRSLIQKVSGEIEPKSEESSGPEGIHASGKEIFLHGLYSSQFLYTVFIPLLIVIELAGQFAGEAEVADLVEGIGTFAAETIGLGFLIVLCVIGWCFLTAIYSLVKTMVKYWDFSIVRRGDKLVLNYGLVKKMDYAIPVEKIQAVVVRQTFVGRICRRYMVDVINVGMNDDEKDIQAFLLPYGKKEVIEKRMAEILPEFASQFVVKEERQPKKVWISWLWFFGIFTVVSAAILLGVAELAPQFMGIVGGGLAVIALAALAVKIAGYVTRGIGIQNGFLVVVNGSFGKTRLYTAFARIQYVELEQNILEKKLGIQQGKMYLLASMANRTHLIPHCKDGIAEQIRNELK